MEAIEFEAVTGKSIGRCDFEAPTAVNQAKRAAERLFAWLEKNEGLTVPDVF
jgi:hypothetical protein